MYNTLSVAALYVLLRHRLRSHRGTENYTDVTEISVIKGLRDCTRPTILLLSCCRLLILTSPKHR